MKHNTILNLSKQNFKFSSAHFLIFDEVSAEKLHGHNYQVHVQVTGENHQSGAGYFVDFNYLKKLIKEACDQWDEHILLPENHPDMRRKISTDGKNYEIHFRDRFYSFPQNEVIWLPVTNTSVEMLSWLMAHKLMPEFKKAGVQKISVTVEESPGQSATTELV